MSVQIPNSVDTSDRLLNEFEAANLLEMSVSPIRRMKAEGALSFESRLTNNRLVPHYRRSTLLATKPCLETAQRLFKSGRADPINGKLWVLKRRPITDSEPRFEIIDLCANGPCVAFTIKEAARKCNRPETALRAAIDADEVPETRIYGGGKLRVVLDRDLGPFIERMKPSKQPDRARFGAIADLANDVGATGKSDRIEVAQQAKLWAKTSKLQSWTGSVERQGAVRKRWKTRNDPANGKLAIKKIYRNVTLYDRATFKALWAAPLTADVDAVKKLTGRNGAPTSVVIAAMEGNSVGKIRLRRVIREAGAEIEWRTANGQREQFYILKHRGPRPPREARSLEANTQWLRKNLRTHGPMLRRELVERAARTNINKTALSAAEKALGCKRDYPFEAKPYKEPSQGFTKGHAGRWATVRLPDQAALPEGEVARMIAEYRAKTAAASQPAESPKQEPRPKGGRPTADDSPARQKQKWCYEQYISGRKLLAILEEGHRTFGRKAPKSEADVFTYAQRWATCKGLPFTKRN